MEENTKLEQKKTKEIKKASEIKNKAKAKRVEKIAEDEFLKKSKLGVKGEFLEGYNKDLIFTRTWANTDKPVAVMLLLHGMVEHGARYDYFAKKCNQSGIIVFCMDLRAHGKTVGEYQNVGKYHGDLFGDCVLDAKKFADYLIQKYKLPLIIFGHSYGSFLTQEFIQSYHNHKMVILCGSANMKGQVDVALGKIVSNIQKLFCGEDSLSKLIYKLSFGAYGKNFENGNWLTRDKEIFDKYNQDPFCGNVCSASFYKSFFKHISKLYVNQNIQNIDKDKPILITSGAVDPVGGKEHKLVDKLEKMYKLAGISHVTCKLWEDCRHEILNELNKDEVQDYIIDFVLKNLNN